VVALRAFEEEEEEEEGGNETLVTLGALLISDNALGNNRRRGTILTYRETTSARFEFSAVPEHPF